jgi:CheY-like chemotaxis protein
MIDVNMPDMDGFEICRQIKRDSILQKTAVVIHTAVADLRDTRERGQHAGASAVFSYPVETQELLQSIRKFVQPTTISMAV